MAVPPRYRVMAFPCASLLLVELCGHSLIRGNATE
jgi:hypothetical protein